MKKKIIQSIKILMELFLMFIIVFCTFQYNLVMYGISQGKGQLTIVCKCESIYEAIQNKHADSTTLTKFKLILAVKKFAIDSLGLKDNGNYECFFNHGNKPILKVLTACLPYQLKPFQRQFPIIGNVAYKGFFNFKSGEKEKQKLDALGYDTDYSPTSAWSTLGWFKDPILSGMLNRNEGQLAELIIHEMTHTTVYLKSSVDFNENLASAIGETGAIQFLKTYFSDTSKYVNNYIERNEDYRKYTHVKA